MNGDAKSNTETNPVPRVLPRILPRVLQVIPELDAGGAERTTVDVAKGIIEAGGKALVATRGGRLQKEIEDAGGLVINLPVHSKNPAIMLANTARLAGLIREHNINIVHARSRAPAWSALRAARRTGAKFVTTYHGTYNARSALKRFYNSGMARGDHVIANSNFIADRIQSEHPGLARNLTVIARGTDLKVHALESVSAERLNALRSEWGVEENGPPLILLPGRLTEWKGQSILIKAVGELAEKGEDSFLIVLAGDPQGRDAYVNSLWDLINAGNLKDKVKMVGHCSDMPAAYALADIVVSASTEPEAFGRIAVEAQAMERPIIATGHGGSEETVLSSDANRTGWRIPPGDPQALATALGECLALSDEGRQIIGKRGRENAKNFSVEAMVASTLGVYANVLSGD